MEHTLRFPLPDDAYRCFWEIKDPLTKVFSKKFNCDIELKGPQLLAARSGSDDSECVYEKALNQGLRITVKKGDMTRQDTDAVVNAANEHLDHIGGLALALVKAGGQQIVHESNQHIAKHGKVKVGGVAVTSGGNLPCKVIIHAVGPMWSSYRPQECESNLEEAIKGVLGYVTNHSNIQSVSIPAVSSGIFGFPLARCGDIIVRTIKMFTSQVKCDHLREIRLVNHDHPTVNAMKTACDKVFGRGDHPRGSLATEINSTQATSATAHFPPAFNVNGLNLYLEKGNLEDQKTDVIVNSIAPDLDLSKGNLSFAILMKAGRKLQDEVFTSHSRSPYHNNHNVLCTPGLGLSCQSVYHTILPHYNDVHSDRALYTVVSKCLLDAELCNSHHSQNPPIPSISFPALGTGILNFPKKLVADIMTQTVYNYAHETRRRLDVHFVIHPQDKESFQAFQEIFLGLKEANVETVRPIESRGVTNSQPEEKCLIIRSQSKEDAQDAEASFIKYLGFPGCVQIEDSHIFLFGIKEHKALSSLGSSKVSIQEKLQDGRAKLEISGPKQDLAKAVVQVELMLLEVQEEHEETLEDEMFELAVQWMFKSQSHIHRYPARANRMIEKAYLSQGKLQLEVNGAQHSFDFTRFPEKVSNPFQTHRKCLVPLDYSLNDKKGSKDKDWLFTMEGVDSSSQEFKDRTKEFLKANLEIVKMERIHNKILSAVYQSKKDSSGDKGLKVYKRVPRENTNITGRVGFHRLRCSPEDYKHGAGIGFSKSLEDALTADSSNLKGSVHIFQAEVAPGTQSEKWNETPCPIESNALELYNSHVDSLKSPRRFVIFDGYRANPQVLFTCKWKGSTV